MDVPDELRGVPEMLAAYALAMPIGWEREKSDRSMGLRTFPLIAVASCAFIIIAQAMSPHENGDWNRTLEGVATGVGFLGAAAIVKHGIHVLGTATAASVWLTAALGAAAGFRLWGIAVALSIISFVTLRLVRALTPEDQSVDRADALVRGRVVREGGHGASARDPRVAREADPLDEPDDRGLAG